MRNLNNPELPFRPALATRRFLRFGHDPGTGRGAPFIFICLL
jgi:hypothetical protein